MLSFAVELEPVPSDPELNAVFAAIKAADPNGTRMAKVFRETFDQLYDGQRTGRYRWKELMKTERAHYGTLIEMNLQREFRFKDGVKLDYEIAGVDVDSKYSFTRDWILPPECFDKLILCSVAADEKSCFSIGLVRAIAENRNAGMNLDGDETGRNRDKKERFNKLGKSKVTWIFEDHPMPENILLQISEEERHHIFAHKNSGQARLHELFRTVQNRSIPRTTIETVGQQKDPMKRVRENGGSRTKLRPEGFLILSGDYDNQKTIASVLGAVVPGPSEVVSVRVVPTEKLEPDAALIENGYWRLARPDEPITTPAPKVNDK